MNIGPNLITAVAGVPDQLVEAGWNTVTVQNHLSDHLWFSRNANPTIGGGSICVPKANANGPGEYTHDDLGGAAWYYKTNASGQFTVVIS